MHHCYNQLMRKVAASYEHRSKICSRINKAGFKLALLEHLWCVLGFLERLTNCKVYLEGRDNPGIGSFDKK